MSPRSRHVLWALLGAGALIRLVLAFKTVGVEYDINSFEMVRGALGTHPLDLYGVVNTETVNRWPYPAGFLPWVSIAGTLATHTGAAFHGLIKLPAIAADLVIAWLVYDYVPKHKLAAAALVALGPSFILISGHHGQIDSVAILPVVAAVWIWDRTRDEQRRALIAGLLIGVGIAIKTFPFFTLVAFLPFLSSWRLRAYMVAAAAVIPVVTLAPFFVDNPHATFHALQAHRAVPGLAGLSLLAQPDLAKLWTGAAPVAPTAFTDKLQDWQQLIDLAVLAPFAALIWIKKPRLPVGVALAFLVIYAVGIGFAFQYAIWAMPFALMAGWLWEVAAIQAALLLPSLMVYAKWGDPSAYLAMMTAIWLSILVMLARLARQVAR